jgi:natural product biosynthesis luciferase-like monooxygenase protein
MSMSEHSKLLAGLTPAQRKHLAQRLAKEGKETRLADISAVAHGPTTETEQIADASRGEAAPPQRRAKGMDMSLLFFSGDGMTQRAGKYRLLLESAKFADQHNFCAVWTPERHFQSFGGLYPNPSVLGAAISTITSRIQIRAGSVVVPLHNPIRVAEEWAVVDNLSGGRVALSFASGYHPGDFILFPESYQDRREITYRNIEIIRRLWAGEAVNFKNVEGEDEPVTILPRPLQPELPVWLTSSSSAATWVKAGELGANILTGLPAIGADPFQSLAERIALYRQTRAAHGHDARAGKVAVMLHAYVHQEMEVVRERVRAPLSAYLRTFMAQGERLIPRDVNPGVEHSRAEDKDALVSFAFNQFLNHHSLLGDPERCAGMITRLQAIGVDEVACLIDFGLDVETVLDGLVLLNKLSERFRGVAEAETTSEKMP